MVYILTSNVWKIYILTVINNIGITTIFFFFLKLWRQLVDLICIALTANDVESLFMG
jgi:uncharacterized membrane protein